MKKFLIWLPIAICFLSTLSCSVTPDVRSKNNLKKTLGDSHQTLTTRTITTRTITTRTKNRNNYRQSSAKRRLIPMTTPKTTTTNRRRHNPSTYRRAYFPRKYIPSRTKLNNLARKAANRYGVEFSLVSAIIKQESRWNPNAISHAGAVGMMQIMPATGKSACGLSRMELFDPSKNINCGVYYFKKQYDKFGSAKLALCAYNAGPHRIRNGRCPRFRETQNYQRKILADWRRKRGGGYSTLTASRRYPLRTISSTHYNPYSAKTIAEARFSKGGYAQQDLWGLYCKAVDQVYYRKTGSSKQNNMSNRATWLNILDTTVNEIHSEKLKYNQGRAMSKNKIKINIKTACPIARR